MSDLLGHSLMPGILNLLSSRMVTVVIGTVDDDGCPHTAPYNQIIAVDADRLRVAVNRQDLTFLSLRDYGQAMVEILEEGDIAAGIKGRARIHRESMRVDCNLAVVEIEVQEVKRDNSPSYVIVQGVRTRHRNEPFLLAQRAIMAELNE